MKRWDWDFAMAYLAGNVVMWALLVIVPSAHGPLVPLAAAFVAAPVVAWLGRTK